MDLRRGLALLGLVLFAVVVLVALAFLLGVFGVPSSRDSPDRSVIANEKLGEWWVRHLERGQQTNVSVDRYLLIDPPESLPASADTIRVDHPSLDFQTTFETDVFGESDT